MSVQGKIAGASEDEIAALMATLFVATGVDGSALTLHDVGLASGALTDSQVPEDE